MPRMSDERREAIGTLVADQANWWPSTLERELWLAFNAERTAHDELFTAAQTHIHGDIVNPATCRLCAITKKGARA